MDSETDIRAWLWPLGYMSPQWTSLLLSFTAPNSREDRVHLQLSKNWKHGNIHDIPIFYDLEWGHLLIIKCTYIQLMI